MGGSAERDRDRMPPPTGDGPGDGGDADAAWRAVRRHLEAENDRIVAEIRNYPPPIAGCDAQYQHLTERRRLIARELARLEAARGDGGADAGVAIAAFLAASAVIDAATAGRLRAQASADAAPPSGRTRPRAD